ncbi:MAG: DUF378 domain-containing protein [Clostridia bacterium]|nr:DUF378 domain-containing protein [Clostridia bacterium]
MFDKTALVIVIIGALNWAFIGLFGIDLVALAFGGQMSILSRIVYTIVGLAGIWSISILFKNLVPKHDEV